MSNTASGTPPADQPSSAGEENAVPVTGLNPAASSSSDLIARNPVAIFLNPSDLSAMIGQEFRVDLSTSALEAIAESTVTVSYDPTLVKFHRVEPGGAAISARATDGQVILTVRRQGAAGTGNSVLAMLFFQAKAKGDVTVTMEAVPSDAGPPPRAERAVIHVQ